MSRCTVTISSGLGTDKVAGSILTTDMKTNEGVVSEAPVSPPKKKHSQLKCP